MRALVAAVRGGPGTFVVTGTAGCGKSAVLSRLVTLSDPKFRSDHQDLVDAIWADLRPRAGDVDVALLATGLTSVDILDQLCNALGVKPAPLQGSGLAAETAGRHQALRERLASGPPVTIVLDALDEAADPWSVLSDVLRPLVEDWHRPSLRLVIGVRSPEPRTSISSMDPSAALGARTLLGATARDLHLDDDHILRADTGIYWDEGDLTAYIVNRLMNPPRGVHSPYQDSVEEATELARNLAELAGKSYVVAQVVARDLASAS
jgi:hypothetical protein